MGEDTLGKPFAHLEKNATGDYVLESISSPI